MVPGCSQWKAPRNLPRQKMSCSEGSVFGPELVSDFFAVFLDFWLDSFASGPSPRKMLCCFYGIHNKPKFFQDLIILLSLYACVCTMGSGDSLLAAAAVS